jgi:hypothetical protein
MDAGRVGTQAGLGQGADMAGVALAPGGRVGAADDEADVAVAEAQQVAGAGIGTLLVGMQDRLQRLVLLAADDGDDGDPGRELRRAGRCARSDDDQPLGAIVLHRRQEAGLCSASSAVTQR